MATTVARLEAVLSASTRDFDRAMDKSEGKMHRVGRVAGIAGAAIAGGLVIGLEKSVHAALNAQVSQSRLEQSFKNARIALGPYTKSIEAAEAAGRKLGFSDEQTKLALGSLITATHDYKKAEDELSVAQDVARFKHVALTDATKMLTMAQTGSQRAAKQLGITVPTVSAAYDALGKNASVAEKAQAKVTDKMATGDAVIQAVRDHVKGQADEYSKTAAGGMEQFRAQLDHLEVSMGTGLLPILTKVSIAVASATAYFSKHATQTKILAAALGVLATALLAARVAQLALNLAVLANPYVAATVAVIALAAGMYLLWTRVKEARPALVALSVVTLGLPAAFFLAYKASETFRNVVNSSLGAVVASIKAVNSALHAVIDSIKWLIKHIPSIPDIHIGVPKIPHIGIPGIGDASGAPPGGGFGPASIDRSLYDELALSRQFGLSLTSGYRPGAVTKHGTPSDHGVYPSKAIDVSNASHPTPQMAGFFRALIGDRGVKQAFYDPLGSIFGGILSSYREGGHSDHVHVATYDQGGWLKKGLTLAMNNTGRPERVLGPGEGGENHFHFYAPVGSERDLMGWVQQAADQWQRSNGGRSAF